MQIVTIWRPQPIELPDPPTPDVLAVRSVVRRARVSETHAGIIAELAGLGPRGPR